MSARDVPNLPFPDNTDLFQLLWCPNWHAAPWYGPHPVTVWRTTAQVRQPLTAPPAPRFEGLDHDLSERDDVPLPCVLHPERVVEYPHAEQPGFSDLPGALDERVRRWQQQRDWLYLAELSTAPGTRLAGTHAGSSPQASVRPRAAHGLPAHIASEEFEPQGRWPPLEDRNDPRITTPRPLMNRDAWAPHGLMLGDGGSLYLLTCTTCVERPLAGTMQCT